eukprot:c20874_g1_i1 orf=416-1690(+)
MGSHRCFVKLYASSNSRRMHITQSVMVVAVLLLVGMAKLLALSTSDKSFNLSANGFAWATAKDGDDLERESELREQKLGLLEDGAETDAGGFSSLDSMFQWAIGHSDPEKLKGAVYEVEKLTPAELEQRGAEIRELLEKLQIPSDAELMKVAISDLKNSSLSAEYRYRALQELLELVEPVDNANDLDKLGGLTVIVEELDREEEELRTVAAWVLGKASQNNLVVQNQILELGVLPKLMKMVQSSCVEESVKALYAVSAMIRNHPSGQAAFYLGGGALLLQEIMSNTSMDIRLRRKSVFLVADLAEQQLEIGSALTYQPSESFLKSVVELTEAPDLDTQEKMQALMALRSLGQLNNATQKVLKESCQVKAALEKMRIQLEELIHDEDQADFARDMESLRQQVDSMFAEDDDNIQFDFSLHDMVVN